MASGSQTDIGADKAKFDNAVQKLHIAILCSTKGNFENYTYIHDHLSTRGAGAAMALDAEAYNTVKDAIETRAICIKDYVSSTCDNNIRATRLKQHADAKRRDWDTMVAIGIKSLTEDIDCNLRHMFRDYARRRQ
jgi:hypothetical protein